MSPKMAPMLMHDSPWWKNPIQALGRKNLIFLGIVLTGLFCAVILMATPPRHAAVEVEERIWTISTVTASPAALSPEMLVFGEVETPEHAQLRSFVAARVTKLHIDEGQWVAKGTALISLEAADEQLKLQQRSAELKDAEATLATVKRNEKADQQTLIHTIELHQLSKARVERLRKLRGKHLVAEEQLDIVQQEVARQGIEVARQQAYVDNFPQRLASAEAAVTQAKARKEAQQLNVDRTTIRAPFAGRVVAIDVSPGDRLDPGHQVARMFNTSALRVRASIPASQAATMKSALAIGREVAAHSPLFHHSLPLLQLSGEVRKGSSAVEALFGIPAQETGVELGQTLDLRVTLPAVANVVALPVQSLYEGSRIYAVDEESRLKGIEVDVIGQRSASATQLEYLVRAPQLTQGMRVLATDLPKATTGLRVRMVESDIARKSPAAHMTQAL